MSGFLWQYSSFSSRVSWFRTLKSYPRTFQIDRKAALLPLLHVAGCPGVERLRPKAALGTPHVAKPLFPMEPDMLLERVKQLGNRDRLIISTSVWVDYHMYMLRHDDVPDQADAESLLQYTKSLGYDSFQAVVVKERQTPSAGDRPEVRITRPPMGLFSSYLRRCVGITLSVYHRLPHVQRTWATRPFPERGLRQMETPRAESVFV